MQAKKDFDSIEISVSSPGTGIFVKQTVMAYYEKYLLGKFYTSYVTHQDSLLSKSLGVLPTIGANLSRRSFNEIPYSNFETYPFKEILRTFSSKVLSSKITDSIWEWAELSFDKWVAGQLDKGINIIHCYEHASLSTLKMAKRLNIFSVYEQPSQHHLYLTKLLNEQVLKFPELRNNSNEFLFDKKSIRRNKRKDEELILADLVLCNSSFTMNSLVEFGVDEKKIIKVPLGFPSIKRKENFSLKSKIIFLSAGTQSIRKGSHLLFEAWKKCNFSRTEAELWVIGKIDIPSTFLTGLSENVVFRNSMPYEDFLKVYEVADVLVLPTLADGFGMVITEAMAKGLMVITTNNSAGADIIDHKKSGFIIDANNIDAIVYSLKWSLENKNKILEIGSEAVEKAGSWQWENYRELLASKVVEKYNERSENAKGI